MSALETSDAEAASAALSVLTRELESGSKESRARRRWQGAVGATMGGLTLSGGTLLLSRDANFAAIGLTAEGAIRLGFNLYLLAADPDPFSPLRVTLARSRQAGDSDAETLQAIQTEWRRLAEKARKQRVTSAIGQLVSASVAGVGAVVVAAIPSERLGMTNREQAFLVGFLTFVGMTNATGGVVDLTVRSTMERSANAFAAAPTSSGARLSVAAVPTSGGLLVSWGGAF